MSTIRKKTQHEVFRKHRWTVGSSAVCAARSPLRSRTDLFPTFDRALGRLRPADYTNTVMTPRRGECVEVYHVRNFYMLLYTRVQPYTPIYAISRPYPEIANDFTFKDNRAWRVADHSTSNPWTFWSSNLASMSRAAESGQFVREIDNCRRTVYFILVNCALVQCTQDLLECKYTDRQLL